MDIMYTSLTLGAVPLLIIYIIIVSSTRLSAPLVALLRSQTHCICYLVELSELLSLVSALFTLDT
jgi:hypothetical protein